MDVDSATACQTGAYQGRTIAVCGPSCTKQFLANPSVYLVA